MFNATSGASIIGLHSTLENDTGGSDYAAVCDKLEWQSVGVTASAPKPCFFYLS